MLCLTVQQCVLWRTDERILRTVCRRMHFHAAWTQKWHRIMRSIINL